MSFGLLFACPGELSFGIKWPKDLKFWSIFYFTFSRVFHLKSNFITSFSFNFFSIQKWLAVIIRTITLILFGLQLFWLLSSKFSDFLNLWSLGDVAAFTREVSLKGKAQYGWPPCTNKFRTAPFYIKSLSTFFAKQLALMRRSTVLSLPP